MKNKISFCTLLAVIISVLPASAEDHTITSRSRKPSLVVNIVVGGMRYDMLDRFASNLKPGGISDFRQSGVSFSRARYDFMPVNAASGMATLTTGANPSTHGVVGEY